MVGIGFFAPLPLALMMPFMAGQSMLMGDAFGKAYQYGKRKISAMTNEEFNKLTPRQLGIEIQSDYSAMIPSLQTAIKQSSAFQSLIIQELAKIVRELPKDIVSGFTQGSNPVQDIVHQTQKEPANIDYGQIALATIKIMLGPIGNAFLFPQSAHAEESSGGFIGPPEPLPDTLSQHEEIQKELIQEDKAKNTPSDKVLSAAEDPVYLAWITKLGTLKAQFQAAQAPLKSSGYSNSSAAAKRATQHRVKIKTRPITSKIRSMSNDYRNPNNHIRENALRLRRNMSQWI